MRGFSPFARTSPDQRQMFDKVGGTSALRKGTPFGAGPSATWCGHGIPVWRAGRGNGCPICFTEIMRGRQSRLRRVARRRIRDLIGRSRTVAALVRAWSDHRLMARLYLFADRSRDDKKSAFLDCQNRHPELVEGSASGEFHSLKNARSSRSQHFWELILRQAQDDGLLRKGLFQRASNAPQPRAGEA